MKSSLLILLIVFSTSVLAQSKATLELFKAIEKNNSNLVLAAIKAGADVNGVDNVEAPTTTAFLKAVKNDRVKIVKILLKNRADINQKRPIDLYTGLMIATKGDHGQMVKLLLDRGADVNSESVAGRTALHIAALNNSLSSARLLVANKDIDVNVRPELCALMVAARQNHTGIVLLLKRQSGAKASSPLCVERAIKVAEINENEDVLAILKRD